MEVGKYYLFACTWDWTYVGRFAGISDGDIVIDHAIYFIRTGRPFGELCHLGLVRSGDGKSVVSECGDGIRIGRHDEPIRKHPWHAEVTWGNPDEPKGGKK